MAQAARAGAEERGPSRLKANPEGSFYPRSTFKTIFAIKAALCALIRAAGRWKEQC